jgi:LuxR family maltose regulon positive regulatory protein
VPTRIPFEVVVNDLSAQFTGGLTLRASPPAVPPGLVRRPRIRALLTRAASGPVTVISAGPGYGKTLCLADWVRSGDAPGQVAWLSIDSADDSVPAFWTSLLVAIRACGVVPAGDGLLDVAPAASFSVGDAGDVVTALARLKTPLVVVLDDLQYLRDLDLLDSINALIGRLPDRLRLVLSSRYDPPLRLRRVAITGGVTEIRSQDLAFTAPEAHELLREDGLELPSRVVDTLVARTRGWAAGLRLAAMGLDRAAPEDAVARLAGSDRAVAEYLTQEVLDQLADSDRSFLLAAGIADPITAELAEVLTGSPDAQARLERLEAHNAFLVGLAGDRLWFTWHPMFRELLQRRLAIERPGAAGDLHHNAAAWFTGRGDHVAAIHHLTDAGDWAAIGRLVTERAAPDIVGSNGPALVAALEPAAARSRVDPNPATLLASALGNFLRFDYDAMLRDVDAGAISADEDESTRDALGIDILVAILRMGYARAREPDELPGAARQVLKVVDQVPRHRVPAVERYRAIARANLGIGLLWSGDLGAAEIELVPAGESCAGWGLELSELSTRGHLAVLDAVRGRHRAARRRGQEARQIAERHGWTSEPQASAHVVALALADLDSVHLNNADELLTAIIGGANPDVGCQVALRILRVQVAVTGREAALAERRRARLQRLVEQLPGLPPMLADWTRVACAEVDITLGNPAMARRKLRHDTTSAYTNALRTILVGRCLLAENRPGEVIELMNDSSRVVEGYLTPMVDARVLVAIAAHRQRRDSLALTSMSEAIDRAAESGIARPFVLAGAEIRMLLTRHRNLVRRHPEFTTSLMNSVSTESVHTMPDSGSALLSERERAVLPFLPTHLKAGDIANELFVSVNTVKTHLQSIYRKLGASSRQEAVARAREMGLL